MKPFNLKEYLENPHRKVVTRDGRPVRIVCTNAKLYAPGPNCNPYPVIALMKASLKTRSKNRPNEEILNSYNENGNIIPGREDRSDLFFETVKVSGWVNIYSKYSGDATTSTIYKTKEEALSNRSPYNLDTVFVEWEE